MGNQTVIGGILFLKRGSTLDRKLTAHFKALWKNRWPDRPPPPQLVLPDAALRCIDPDSVVQVECEWMNGSALLTCTDLCNRVWPSAFPQSHLKFVSMNNLCVYFPFPAFPRERMAFHKLCRPDHTKCPWAIVLPNAYSPFFTLGWLLA